MSLFFLSFTIVTYFLGHQMAKRTKPNRQMQGHKQAKFKGSYNDFEKLVKLWLVNNPKLSIIEKNNDYYLLGEEGGIFSYGSFFHIHIKMGNPSLEITIAHQPKLVSAASEERVLNNHFDLEFKDVI